MSRVQISIPARSDLDEIWFYIAEDNPDAADKFIRSLVSRFSTLRVFRKWDAEDQNCLHC
jgi:plasmid stabilization system protein ParE